MICFQAAQATSIITACTPQLTTFFGSLVSGMLRVDDLRRQHGSFSSGTTNSRYLKYSLNEFRSRLSSHRSLRIPSAVRLGRIGSSLHRERADKSQEEDAGSTSSNVNIITRRRDLEVMEEQYTPGSQDQEGYVVGTVSSADMVFGETKCRPA